MENECCPGCGCVVEPEQPPSLAVKLFWRVLAIVVIVTSLYSCVRSISRGDGRADDIHVN